MVRMEREIKSIVLSGVHLDNTRNKARDFKRRINSIDTWKTISIKYLMIKRRLELMD